MDSDTSQQLNILSAVGRVVYHHHPADVKEVSGIVYLVINHAYFGYHYAKFLCLILIAVSQGFTKIYFKLSPL